MEFVKFCDGGGGRGFIGLEFEITSINKVEDSSAGGSFAIYAHGVEGSS